MASSVATVTLLDHQAVTSQLCKMLPKQQLSNCLQCPCPHRNTVIHTLYSNLGLNIRLCSWFVYSKRLTHVLPSCRYEQERCRNERLRRVLRCIPNKDSCCFLPAQPSILKTSQPLSPRTSAQQLQQQQQHRLHRHSVPLLPTLDELKTDLRFSSSPNVTAAPEGLAPAGPVAADLALPSSDDQKGPLAAATAAVQDGPARDRSLASLSHDGVIRPIQATAVSCVAAAAAGIGGTRELSRQQRQQQLDPFSSYSSQDLEQAADDLSDIQLQQQQHDRQPIAGHYNGLTATLSATASPTAAAAAADRSDRRFPPPFRRSATLPRNWEQFTAEVGKSFTAGDMNLLRLVDAVSLGESRT